MIASSLTVSIIVPAHNEGHRLHRCLETVIPAAQDRGWDVIVVDDGSTDNTSKVAEGLGAKTIRHPSPLGVAAARNCGARHAKTDILLFVDADIVAPVSTLYTLVDRLAECDDIHATGAHAAVSDLNSGWGSRFVELRACTAFCCFPRRDISGLSCLQSECGAIRRSVFEELDGFSEKYYGVGMEEFAMGHKMERLGYVNMLLADAPYAHHYKSLFHRGRELIRRTSRWVPLLFRRRRLESAGAVDSPQEPISCALSMVMLCSIILACVYPWAWLVVAVACVMQVILEWRFLQYARRTYGVLMMVYAWPALQLPHIAIAIGFALGVLRVAVRPLTRNR